jgi:hypothetical protein
MSHVAEERVMLEDESGATLDWAAAAAACEAREVEVHFLRPAEDERKWNLDAEQAGLIVIPTNVELVLRFKRGPEIDRVKASGAEGVKALRDLLQRYDLLGESRQDPTPEQIDELKEVLPKPRADYLPD